MLLIRNHLGNPDLGQTVLTWGKYKGAMWQDIRDDPNLSSYKEWVILAYQQDSPSPDLAHLAQWMLGEIPEQAPPPKLKV